jgi:hypothetical protein
LLETNFKRKTIHTGKGKKSRFYEMLNCQKRRRTERGEVGGQLVIFGSFVGRG